MQTSSRFYFIILNTNRENPEKEIILRYTIVNEFCIFSINCLSKFIIIILFLFTFYLVYRVFNCVKIKKEK